MSSSEISPSMLQACQSLIYNWAHAMDTKTWSSLSQVFAPTISADYSAVGIPKGKIPSAMLVKALGGPTALGRPEVKTTHFVGAQKWNGLEGGKVRCEFQVEAKHLVTKPGEEDVRVNGNGWYTMEFEQVKGEWRVVLVKVSMNYVDGDWGKVFASKVQSKL